MNSKQSIIVSLVAIVAGALMLAFNTAVTSHGILITAGAAFIVAGAACAVYALTARNADGRRQAGAAAMGSFGAVCAFIIGGCVLGLQAQFMTATPWVFGALSALAALMLCYLLAVRSHSTGQPGWLFAGPLAIAVLTVLTMLLTAPADDSRMLIYTGTALCIYGVTDLISVSVYGARLRSRRRAEALEEAESDVLAHQPHEEAPSTDDQPQDPNA